MRAPLRLLVLTFLAALAACAREAPSTVEPVDFRPANGISATTITLTSYKSQFTYGEPITLNATVAGGYGTPTGYVSIVDGADVLYVMTLDGAGHIYYVTRSTLSAGSHSLRAEYAGDTTYAVSWSSSLQVEVSPVPTASTLVANPASSIAGRPGGW
jgi:hypothetical protein